MSKQISSMSGAALLALLLTGCGGGGSSSGAPVAELVVPSTYMFENESLESTVSYTGQTARHLLVEELVDYMLGQLPSRNAANDADAVFDGLDFYVTLDATARDASVQPVSFTVPGGEPIIFGGGESDFAASINAGDVSSSKRIRNKLAGEDKVDHLLDGREGFFGWTGLSPNTPAGLVDELLVMLAAETQVTDASIATVGGSVPIPADNPRVTADGVDLRQMIQKFVVGALTFSQGTADYLSIDFGSNANLTLAAGKTYTEGAHDYDEAFGYFGAARNYNDLADSAIKSDVDNDANGDGLIDIRSEYNFGHSTNCAKRDLGSTSGTDFTKDAFDAFLKGRAILQEAADGATESAPGSLSAARAQELESQIEIVAQTWEKCIAATVVHYINDVTDDMANFDNDTFADLDNFLNLAKHWAEMKGFALALQFSPYSPFRTGEIDGVPVGVTVADLQEALARMGQAPVLADGTMEGVDYVDYDNSDVNTTPAERVSSYQSDLEEARDIFELAYGFDVDDVANW